MKNRSLKAPAIGILGLAVLIILSGCDFGFNNTNTQGSDNTMINKSNESGTMTEKGSYEMGRLQEYSPESYQAAINDGKTVLLDFHAEWCIVCKGNEPELKAAVEKNNNIVAFKVDYDTEREIKKEFNIQGQATYLLIKNGEEAARIMGTQDEAKFTAFMSSQDAMMEVSEELIEGDTIMKKADYQAGMLQPFNQAAYDAAIADGKIVFVDFFADWCPVCQANKPDLANAFEGASENLVGFTANYDTEKDLKKEFGITTQSTYILVKDGKETDRILGRQDEEKFKNFLSI